MNGRVIALVLLLLCVAADAWEKPIPREPNCPQRGPNIMCAMVFEPVCGSNSQTYSNECNMCSRLGKDEKVWIVKNGECSSPKRN